MAKHEPNGWQMSGDPHAWPDGWATEILPLARAAITRVQIDDIASRSDEGHPLKWDISLPDGYGAWADQQAITQLGKAGFRLAALLEAIFEGEQSAPPASPPTVGENSLAPCETSPITGGAGQC